MPGCQQDREGPRKALEAGGDAEELATLVPLWCSAPGGPGGGSGRSCGCQDLRGGGCSWHRASGPKDAAQHPTGPRTAPQRVTWPRCQQWWERGLVCRPESRDPSSTRESSHSDEGWQATHTSSSHTGTHHSPSAKWPHTGQQPGSQHPTGRQKVAPRRGGQRRLCREAPPDRDLGAGTRVGFSNPSSEGAGSLSTAACAPRQPQAWGREWKEERRLGPTGGQDVRLSRALGELRRPREHSTRSRAEACLGGSMRPPAARREDAGQDARRRVGG